MGNKKSLTIVIIATILFGVLSKWLVGIPYMSLKYFDLYFVLSFLLWTIYEASLYTAGKMNYDGNDPVARIGGQGLIFGMLVSCLKTGVDSLLMMFVERTKNQILLTFIMEIVILLFGSVTMILIFWMKEKKKFVWDKSLNKAALLLGGVAVVYGIVFFSFNSKYQTSAPYADVSALEESGIVNLNTLMGVESILQDSKIFTMLSVIVIVIFFIGVWFVLEKRNHKNR